MPHDNTENMQTPDTYSQGEDKSAGLQRCGVTLLNTATVLL